MHAVATEGLGLRRRAADCARSDAAKSAVAVQHADDEVGGLSPQLRADGEALPPRSNDIITRGGRGRVANHAEKALGTKSHSYDKEVGLRDQGGA